MENAAHTCSCEICYLRSLFFEHLAQNELGELCDNKIERTYQKGDVIIEAGEEIKDFLYLKEGLVKIYKTSESGENQILSIAKPQDFVCIFTIFSDTHYKYSMSALNQVSICSIRLGKVKEKVHQNGAFAFGLLHRISLATDQIIKLRFDISKKNLHGRIAYILLFLCDEIFQSENFELPISRKEFSEFIGMSIENVIRCLSEFRKDNLLIINGKTIEIRNKELLKRISESG